MAFYEYSSPPQYVQPKSKEQTFLISSQKAPKYRNLMFEKKVCHGLTIKCLLDIEKKEIESQMIENSNLNLNSAKFKKYKTKNQNSEDFEIQKEQLLITQKPKEGFFEHGTITEEYFEDLSNNFSTKNQSSQTDSLLNRAIKANNIITAKGQSVGCQIESTDYLIDFDEQTQSVIRVLLNKILEEGRMEVLEEIEMEKMKQQKNRAQQEKLKILNKLQRAQYKENRINEETQKRKFQSELSKKNSEAAYKKLCVRGLSKRFVAKMQLETGEYLKDIGEYLEVSSAKIYTDFLPILEEQVIESLSEKSEYDFISQKMMLQSKQFLTQFHTETMSVEEQRHK